MNLHEVIPITYMSGTGGNFLCHLIVSAKRKVKTIPELSRYGNIHVACIKDIPGPPHGINVDDQIKLNWLKNCPCPDHALSPYYTAAHIKNPNILREYFKKSIRITFDSDDISTVSSVFLGKYFIDEMKVDVTDLSSYKCLITNKLTSMLPFFKKDASLGTILFISWKELFNGEVDALLYKLSEFTGIDSTEFSTDALSHWRDKTRECIDTFI